MPSPACRQPSPRGSYAWPFALVLLGVMLSVEATRLFGVNSPLLQNKLAVIALFHALAGTALSSAVGCALARRNTGTIVAAQLVLAALFVTALVVLVPARGTASCLLPFTAVYAAASLPFCIWRMRKSYAAIPATLDDAATLDGCTTGLRFSRVILPNIARDLVATLLFSLGVAIAILLFAAPMLPVR
jgi:multiple sugar transport system permease protein